MSDVLVRLEWFKAMILPHEAAVRRRLARLCPQGFDVDNLIAESLARAYHARDIGRITAGRAYLYSIARNLLIDALRRETIVSLDFLADLDVLRSEERLEAVLDARDELRVLGEVIDALPAQCREAFLLKRVHDLPVAEVADRMGLSVSTVEKHLAKAVRLVAAALAQREGTWVERDRTECGLDGVDRRAGRGPRR